MRHAVHAVMISCRQRVEDRRRTMEHLIHAGIYPEIILSECNPAGGAENARTAHRALQAAAAEPEARPVLFLEDDLDLADDFTDHLRAGISTNSVTYLYLNDTPARLRAHHGTELAEKIIRGEPIPWGPTELIRPAAPYGTQAVIIPARLLGTMLEITARPDGQAFDARLRNWLQAEHDAGRERAYTSLPHPVQHRNATAGRDEPTYRHRQRISLSYGLPAMRGSSHFAPTP